MNCHRRILTLRGLILLLGLLVVGASQAGEPQCSGPPPVKVRVNPKATRR